MTKADLTSEVQNALTLNAGVTTWSDHEAFLIGTTSLLESIYPAVIQETEALAGIVIPTGDVSYTVNIVKVGRKVTLTGVCVNTSGLAGEQIIFNIDQTNTSYAIDNNAILSLFGSNIVAIGDAKTVLTREAVGVAILDDGQVYLQQRMGINESFFFSITYNTLA